MLGKNAPDQRIALLRERRISRTAILRTRASLDQALLLETVHEEGDTAAGDEYSPLDLAQQQWPLVIQSLEDAELGDGQVVSRDVRLRVPRHGGVRSRENDEQL